MNTPMSHILSKILATREKEHLSSSKERIKNINTRKSHSLWTILRLIVIAVLALGATGAPVLALARVAEQPSRRLSRPRCSRPEKRGSTPIRTGSKIHTKTS